MEDLKARTKKFALDAIRAMFVASKKTAAN
jgi:hypothetical protein